MHARHRTQPQPRRSPVARTRFANSTSWLNSNFHANGQGNRMPTVNPQITDAVTDASRAMPAGVPAPPAAMGSVYQSLAHATGILFENAVAAQQQQNTLAQAAANQGVMQIYSLDTTAAAGAAPKVAATPVVAAGDGAVSLATAVQLASAPLDAARSATARVDGEIEQALQAALATSRHGGDVAYGVRAAADALAAAIDRINRANHDNLLRIVQLAGVAACLAAMVREPDKADAYQSILQTLRQLD
jgi:hypothetical protein